MTDKRVIHVNFADRRRWLKGSSAAERTGNPAGGAPAHWYSKQFWQDFDRVNAADGTVAADVESLNAGARHAKAVAVGREILAALAGPITRRELADRIHRRWTHEHAAGLTDSRPFSATHIRKHVLTRDKQRE